MLIMRFVFESRRRGCQRYSLNMACFSLSDLAQGEEVDVMMVLVQVELLLFSLCC